MSDRTGLPAKGTLLIQSPQQSSTSSLQSEANTLDQTTPMLVVTQLTSTRLPTSPASYSAHALALVMPSMLAREGARRSCSRSVVAGQQTTTSQHQMLQTGLPSFCLELMDPLLQSGKLPASPAPSAMPMLMVSISISKLQSGMYRPKTCSMQTTMSSASTSRHTPACFSLVLLNVLSPTLGYSLLSRRFPLTSCSPSSTTPGPALLPRLYKT